MLVELWQLILLSDISEITAAATVVGEQDNINSNNNNRTEDIKKSLHKTIKKLNTN